MTTNIELDDDLYAALEMRAKALGLAPAALAQRLPRTQLAGTGRAQSQAFQRNHAAFQEKLPELLQTRRGQFVAFYDGKLVGFGLDRFELRKEVISKYGYVDMLVTEVTEIPRVRYILYRRRVR
jgi:hypothetical protein